MKVSAGAAWAVVLVLLGGTGAQSGYRALNEAWGGYSPPALYPQARPPAGPLPVGGADDFPAQVSRLREEAARWERDLSSPRPEAAFYVPNEAHRQALESAAGDAGAAAAAAALRDGFALEDLEILALLRGPAVAAAERAFRATLEAYGQVAGLDEVLRRYASFTASLMTGVGGGSSEAVAARFPFPGVLALKGEVASQEVAAARETWVAARRDAVTAARDAYWELLYVWRAGEVTGETLALLDHLKAAATERYAAGGKSFQDVVRVGIEREKAREELTTLTEERRNVEARVRELLALAPEVPVGKPAPGTVRHGVPSLTELYPLAAEWSQELRAVRAQIAKMERLIALAETMVYPRFTLNLSLFERDEVSPIGGSEMGKAPDAFPTSTTAFMGVGLPKMPWYGTQDAYLREARQRLAALREDLRAQEATTDLRVREAWFRLDRVRREESLYGERVVTLSQAALEASIRGYSAGEVSFADLIESYRGWLEANLTLERRHADLGIARAALEAAVGVSPLPPAVPGGE